MRNGYYRVVALGRLRTTGCSNPARAYWNGKVEEACSLPELACSSPALGQSHRRFLVFCAWMETWILLQLPRPLALLGLSF